ncbi:hypothetical protein O9993_13270 [Vibrio lentus]|nr:hypothetical protein [Vibrio lentus]
MNRDHKSSGLKLLRTARIIMDDAEQFMPSYMRLLQFN